MATIFQTSYAEILKRLDGQASPKRTRAGDSGQFSELLSEVEKPKEAQQPVRQAAGKIDGSSRASLSYGPPNAPANSLQRREESISNLSFTETERFLTNHESVQPHYRLSPNDLMLNSEQTKIAVSPSVTETPKEIWDVVGKLTGTSKSDLLMSGMPPSAPKLLGIRTLEELPAIKPELPALKPKPIDLKAYSDNFLEKIIHTAGVRHGVDPRLSVAVARAESSLNADAVSKDGHQSKGVFQLLDTTGQELMGRLDVKGGYDPFNPNQNVNLGVGYLRRLHDLFSKEVTLTKTLKTSPVNSAEDLEKVAVAAFNAGEGNVARAQRKALSLGKDPGSYDAIEPHLPASTRTYVKRVGALKNAATAADDETNLA